MLWPALVHLSDLNLCSSYPQCRCNQHLAVLFAATKWLRSYFLQSKHTIILVQFTPNRGTRTWLDFETVTQAMEGTLHASMTYLTLELGVVHLYEDRLKQQHPHVRNITYDVADLNLYIDNLTDLSALVYGFSMRC